MKGDNLLLHLLARGDIVSIENGRLCVQSQSGKMVPNDWLLQNKDHLIREAVMQLGITALEYESNSTGRYVEGRGPGITLQFHNILTEENPYAIFNVYLDRVRSSKRVKAGTPLPNGHFRVGKKMNFYKFWQKTGLKMPPRLSSFHDYMGNLRRLVFTANYNTKGERLDAATLHPLSVTHEQLLAAFNLVDMPYKSQTIPGQQPDNSRTRFPDKDFLETQQPQGLQPIPTTGESNYGTSRQGGTDTRGNVVSIDTHKKPQDQTVEEWLRDYDSEDAK